jgi:16S rRNA processing protein RimM
MSDDIILGLIIKPHGLNGSIKVKSFADSLESFTEPKRLYLVTEDGQRHEITVEKASGMGKLLTVKLAEINTREAAEDVVGSQIVIKREDLPETQEDEYYWHDLLGMEVFDPDGNYYGVITAILPTGSNDVFVVEGKAGDEVLIPGTYEAILEVNIPEKKMIIEPFSGPVYHDTN